MLITFNRSDIKIGDKVWAYNEENGEKSLQEVVHLIVGEGDKSLVDIVLENGESITATEGHPFYSADSEDWVKASELSSDKLLQNIFGETLRIRSVQFYTEKKEVYNLTVANDHTYYVGHIWTPRTNQH